MIEIRSRLMEALLLTVDAPSLQGVDLSGALLPGANLVGVDLSGANLSGVKIYEADLSNANLVGANLTDALLADTKFMSAQLCDSILVGASLSRADLSYANLSGANLEGASLERTYLFQTYLANTYLGQTRVREAVFACCPSLHQAWGLCEAGKLANGHGSAVLDHRTLRACLKHLPDAFLRNIGYRREEIAGLRDLYL